MCRDAHIDGSAPEEIMGTAIPSIKVTDTHYTVQLMFSKKRFQRLVEDIFKSNESPEIERVYGQILIYNLLEASEFSPDVSTVIDDFLEKGI